MKKKNEVCCYVVGTGPRGTGTPGDHGDHPGDHPGGRVPVRRRPRGMDLRDPPRDSGSVIPRGGPSGYEISVPRGPIPGHGTPSIVSSWFRKISELTTSC
eukprot:1138118-Pelagomonas_calceolata.AAC.1